MKMPTTRLPVQRKQLHQSTNSRLESTGLTAWLTLGAVQDYVCNQPDYVYFSGTVCGYKAEGGWVRCVPPQLPGCSVTVIVQ